MPRPVAAARQRAGLAFQDTQLRLLRPGRSRAAHQPREVRRLALRYPRAVVKAAPASASGPLAELTSPAKARIISAAAGLFTEHGVGGTSLQMIADAIGVTKA